MKEIAFCLSIRYAEDLTPDFMETDGGAVADGIPIGPDQNVGARDVRGRVQEKVNEEGAIRGALVGKYNAVGPAHEKHRTRKDDGMKTRPSFLLVTFGVVAALNVGVTMPQAQSAEAIELGDTETFTALVAAQVQTAGEAQVTTGVIINVRNANCGFTPITLHQVRNGWQGPKGEASPTLPCVGQFQETYGVKWATALPNGYG